MSDLPSGTVAFLFTDIEGSTKRWERQPQAMAAAVARHDALLRTAIAEHSGHVFKTVGDAFCATFATADDALAAALAAQRGLAAEQWGAVGEIRVRMAVHVGAAEERDADYFGPAVNRVARLLSAGHGGQVLLSLASEELLHDRLPADADLRDLGEHRLKDLARPERIFQLAVPDLPSDFPLSGARGGPAAGPGAGELALQRVAAARGRPPRRAHAGSTAVGDRGGAGPGPARVRHRSSPARPPVRSSVRSGTSAHPVGEGGPPAGHGRGQRRTRRGFFHPATRVSACDTWTLSRT